MIRERASWALILSVRMVKPAIDIAHRVSEVANPLIAPLPEDTLEELGLISVPSSDKICRDLERHILLPPRCFPDHWLPVHQVWDINHFAELLKT